METILITGGFGLIGNHLSKKLEKNGYNVAILSREKPTKSFYKTYTWDVSKKYIEKEAIENADFIIHLAGANIGEKRWNQKRKKELLDSRVNSTKLLFEYVKKHNPKLKAFIAASAIGYYGSITSDKIYDEDDKPINDFLSNLCVSWEQELLQFKSINIRTVILRTGIVLTKNGGALEKIKNPIIYNIGAILGKGNQYMPWIHKEDLTNLYLLAIENISMNGIYNAVAPEHHTNKSFTKLLAKALNKSILLPNIPEFIIKLIFGELSVIILKGSRVSSKKTSKVYQFKFKTLSKAFTNLFNQNH